MDGLLFDFSTLLPEIRAKIDSLMLYIYEQITSSRYLKDVKYSEFVHYTKQEINKIFPEKNLCAMIYFTNELLITAEKKAAYSSFETRFERYLTMLYKKYIPVIEDWAKPHSQEEWTELFLSAIKKIVSPFAFETMKNILLKIKFQHWQTWLQNPTFERYKIIQASCSSKERQNNLAYLLPILKKHLYSTQVQRIYLNILYYEKLYEPIIEYMLHFEHQPLALTDEKKTILTNIEKENMRLLLPVYHQFIVRLIEKKTKRHYTAAISYMKKLRKIYQQLNEQRLFEKYLEQMQQKYKSYRALIQEMKKLD